MAERKPEWPEIGDLIIATIETATDYVAYAKLDEYGKRGLSRKCSAKVVQSALSNITKVGGQGTFRRGNSWFGY